MNADSMPASPRDPSGGADAATPHLAPTAPMESAPEPLSGPAAQQAIARALARLAFLATHRAFGEAEQLAIWADHDALLALTGATPPERLSVEVRAAQAIAAASIGAGALAAARRAFATGPHPASRLSSAEVMAVVEHATVVDTDVVEAVYRVPGSWGFLQQAGPLTALWRRLPPSLRGALLERVLTDATTTGPSAGLPADAAWRAARELARAGCLRGDDPVTGAFVARVRAIALPPNDQWDASAHRASQMLVFVPDVPAEVVLAVVPRLNLVTQEEWRVPMTHPNANGAVWAACLRERPDRLASYVVRQPRLVAAPEVQEALLDPRVATFLDRGQQLAARCRGAADDGAFQAAFRQLLDHSVAEAATLVASLPRRSRRRLGRDLVGEGLSRADAAGRLVFLQALADVDARDTGVDPATAPAPDSAPDGAPHRRPASRHTRRGP